MGMMDTSPQPADNTPDAKAMVVEAEKALDDIAAIKDAVSDVIFGQESVVERTLLAVLSGGHALLVGVPGLAKTKLVTTLGTVLGLSAARVQFTPDLMPSDILGSEGSPMMGTQLNSRDQIPYRSYHRSARASCAGETGNQRASRKRSTNRPSPQLTTEPSTLPMLATTTSNATE